MPFGTDEIAASLRAKGAIRRCLKCNYVSGDDWRQCDSVCPVSGSPHHDALTQYAFERLPLAKQDEYGEYETRLRNIP